MKKVFFASVMIGFLLVLGTAMADDDTSGTEKGISLVRMNRIHHDKELISASGETLGGYDSSLISVHGLIVNLTGIRMMVFPSRQAQ